ncbi:substrate-binding protein [Hymenobacter psychrotolerans DSM 18569]|uniref:Substrate-binding protein n=1 Tax=Hymenobacter psychrotolerans DSM 18569 TaxID=1121959 RepID=A0A1M7BP38_9BACT|nr:substrate-binding protein [Hymenobacter psychrotolerans DSM 18569]
MQLPPLFPPLTVTDQMGRRVAVPFPPRRIVSLVPSQTELLFALGLGQQVVGVTKFCIHPAEARQQATVIGGTKNFDFEKIAALQPDLIIGNKEENYQEGIEQLAAQYPGLDERHQHVGRGPGYDPAGRLHLWPQGSRRSPSRRNFGFV